MNVSNRKCVRHLSLRSLWANRTRNLVAVLAIALTTVLFTSLFTIALSINEGFQQSNFRQVGGYAHGGFKYLTEEQFNQLKEDPLIKEWGLRRFLGMPTDPPFNKSHVEVGYSDRNQAKWMYCVPEEGRLPEEGTDEAATDTRVLELLGIEPELGTRFTVTFLVDGQPTTQTFTLCGWWTYDEAITANHILIPESRVDQVLAELEITPPGSDGMTASWNLDVMLKNSLHIEKDLNQILQNHGYQSDSRADRDNNYISIGVNWGYSGSQLAGSLDLGTLLTLAAALLLIVFTGYLIIYNVFQISIAGDIRFYGLLKTIGTTPRQLRQMIRTQALVLSIAGIPLGLILGWLIGSQLTPVVISRFNSLVSVVSVSPVIFVASTLFALFTVLLSTHRPGRMAAKVSPIEALRYTEGGKARPHARRNGKGVSLLSMAWTNLGRSRAKTAITILSLSLAVVLLNLTVTFTKGFDMDKYLQNIVTDFQIADSDYFRAGTIWTEPEQGLPEAVIDAITAQEGITGGGRTYGKTTPILEYVTEDYFRTANSRWYSAEQLDTLITLTDRNEQGLLASTAQLYGMEPFILEHLTVCEGDLSRLMEPGGNYIAAVCMQDNYGNVVAGSHWAKLGDTVTLRYVERYEYYNPDTGEVYPEDMDLSNIRWVARAAQYRDVTYTVAALVTVPSALDYRFYGNDKFILNAQDFIRDTGTANILYYAFDTDDAHTASMESFLKNYTQQVNPLYDYESKSTYAAEFEGFRNMFTLLGGTLSFIVGLVGILNFFNAILTGITVRHREFAVLQSIGMTGRQLKKMLMLEGLLYTLGSVLVSLIFAVAFGPLISSAMGSIYWFFTYRFTVLPIVAVIPAFLLLGIALPLISYRWVARYTIVDRLRQE